VIVGVSAVVPASAIVAPPSRSLRVPLGDGLVAALTEKDGIYLEAVPRRGEGLFAFTRRLCGDERLAPQVLEANGGGGVRGGVLQAGMRYRIPFELLSNDWHL